MLTFADSTHEYIEFTPTANGCDPTVRFGEAALQYSSILETMERKSGLSMSLIDSIEGCFLGGLAKVFGADLAASLPNSLLIRTATVCRTTIENVWAYGVQVPGTQLLAGGLLIASDQEIPTLLMEAATAEGVAVDEVQRWAQRHSGIRPEMAQRLLQSVHDLLSIERQKVSHEKNTHSLTTQLGQVYEEIVLIQDLAQYLRPDVDPQVLAEAVMERIRTITECELTAICLHRGTAPVLRSTGDWRLAPSEIESLVQEIQGDRKPQVLVRNHIEKSSLRLRYPGIRSLVAVPLFERDTEPSWLVVANPTNRQELGSEEANLLRSIGGVLASHSQVIELFRSHEEMVLAFIRSLVSTLDAKDRYTRGHSERVALVAQRIAVEMGLSEEKTLQIYQSGLLHDIGKIGVDDALIRKPEALSAIEFRKIARHPEVGYAILSELPKLEPLLPGVLHHHERFDGRGYPSQLAGNAIPQMARILAVADAFDAMGSDRPYRRGKEREEVERILNEGIGTQWDPEVVEAFFSARLDIYRIWSREIEKQGHEIRSDEENS